MFLSNSQLYSPITVESSQDEAVGYVPRARIFFEGKQTIVGDIALFEYRHTPALLPILNPVIIGGLARVVGSMDTAIELSDFLFPALIYFLVYIICLSCTRRKLLSMAAAALFVFFPLMGISSPASLSSVWEFIGQIFGIRDGSLYFGRFDYPQVTFPFFCVALYATLYALRGKGHLSVIVAGVFAGALFYTYFYDWVYFFCSLAILCGIFLLRREYSSLKRTCGILLVGAVISIPYWVNFSMLHGLPQYGDIVSRIGVEISHGFRFMAWKGYARFLGLAAVLFFFVRQRESILISFLGSMLCAAIVVLNFQMLTGWNPQPDHWYRVQAFPVFLALLVIVEAFYTKYLLSHFASVSLGQIFFWRNFAYGAVICFLAMQLYGQYAYSKATAAAYVVDVPYQMAYTWLRNTTPADSVVGAIDRGTNYELQFEAHNKIFIPNGTNTVAPNIEIWKRFLLVNRLFSVSEDDFKDTARHHLLYLFHNHYRKDKSLDSYNRGGLVLEVPQYEQEAIETAYKELLAVHDVNLPYRIDYLLLGPREEKIGALDPSREFDLEKVYDRQGVKIYSWH